MDIAWSIFKYFVDTRSFLIQYTETSDAYFIWSLTSDQFVSCRILKDGGADQIDFEANYKAAANQPIIVQLPADAATQTTLAAINTKTPSLGQGAMAASTPVVIASNQSAVVVSGTFWQATQPVSGTVTANAGSGTFAVSGPLTDTQLRATPVPVSGTVSAAQSGTWTVQPGNTANTTAWKVDGSAVTQPVSGSLTVSGTIAATQSGTWNIATVTAVTTITNPVAVTQSGSWTVTANAGSNLNTSALALDATLTGGTQQSQIKSGAKGSSAAALITSTASGANHQPVDVAIYDASGNQITSFGGGTQYADGAARGTATGTLMMVDDGTLIQSASGDNTGKLNVNAIQSGTWNIGTVSTVTAVTAISNALPAGTNAIGKLAANSGVIIGDVNVVNSNVSTNIAQMNGVTVTMGNGGSGTGVQRVTIANDSTGIIALTTSAAVIGSLVANQSVNTAQVNGVTTLANAGSVGTGAQRIAIATAATGTTSTVAGSATSVQLLAANTSRIGVIIYNDGNADLKIKFGTTASSTNFSILIPKNTNYEGWAPLYNGRIDGIWSSAAGNARITEIT